MVKVNIGLCKVEDIVHLDGREVDREKLYYLLIPVSDEKRKVYVPTDRATDTIRKALDREQAWEVIKTVSQIDEITVENEKLREKQYKDAIRSAEPRQLIGIIKTMYGRKRMRSAQGKKSTSMDEYYFRLAEEYLHEELAHAIGRDKDEMPEVIAAAMRGEVG